MALRIAQPITEISTRNLPGGGSKVRSVRKADKLAAIYEAIVQKCRSLDISTLWASTACYVDSCTLLICR
jgi:hypothetical protein